MDSNKSVWTRIDDDTKLFFLSLSSAQIFIDRVWLKPLIETKKKQKLKSWLKLYYAKDYHESSLIQWNNMWNTNKHRFNKPLSAMKWLQFILQKMGNFMNFFGRFFFDYFFLFFLLSVLLWDESDTRFSDCGCTCMRIVRMLIFISFKLSVFSAYFRQIRFKLINARILTLNFMEEIRQRAMKRRGKSKKKKTTDC